ncbi:MAG TPA: hypothetical protein VNL71_00095, partial [Chloroflexota bacterium]|nr:hypothetical protein [Chloroflexota bacterium]
MNHLRLTGLACNGRHAGKGGDVSGVTESLAIIAEFRRHPGREPWTSPRKAEEDVAVRMVFSNYSAPPAV